MEVVGSREVTGASCGTHAFGLTDVAVPDRRPVRGGFGPHHVRPGAMERPPSGSNRWHLDGSIFRIEWTDEQVLVPMVSARSQAAYSASGPCGLARRMMPRQERKPCSALSVNACIHLPGNRWLRSRRITSISVAVLVNRPGFTGGQNSRRIGRYGTATKEDDLEAVFARVT